MLFVVIRLGWFFWWLFFSTLFFRSLFRIFIAKNYYTLVGHTTNFELHSIANLFPLRVILYEFRNFDLRLCYFFCKQIHWIEAKRGNKNSLFFFCSLCLMSLILLLLFLLLLFVCNDKHEFATTIFFITTHHKRIFGSQIVVFFLFFSPHWCGYFVLLFVYKPNISSIVLCKYRIHVENSPISTCKWKKTDDRSF